MEPSSTKTIDDYRNHCMLLREVLAPPGFHPSNAYADVASAVLKSLADTGSVALFVEVEEEVRRMILRDLRHYRRTGERQLINFRTHLYHDGRAEARAAIATLAAAGLVPQSMTRNQVPVPMFRGTELIRGMESLDERLACDDILLDVQLVGLAQHGLNPHRLTMSLLTTEHERHDVDDAVYDRVAKRSCLATFALHQHAGMYFWPRFGLGYVHRLTVVQEIRPRGQRALIVKLDMGGGARGRLWCRDMELLGVEEVSCA